MSAATQDAVACPSCGKTFACDPQGACWCKALDVRLPLPAAADACWCPACLAAHARKEPAPARDD